MGSGFSFLSLPASVGTARPGLFSGSRLSVSRVYLSMARSGLGSALLPLPFLPTLDES